MECSHSCPVPCPPPAEQGEPINLEKIPPAGVWLETGKRPPIFFRPQTAPSAIVGWIPVEKIVKMWQKRVFLFCRFIYKPLPFLLFLLGSTLDFQYISTSQCHKLLGILCSPFMFFFFLAGCGFVLLLGEWESSIADFLGVPADSLL